MEFRLNQDYYHAAGWPVLKKYSSDWLNQYTPLRIQPRELAKEDYNIVRLGILRLGRPLDLEIEDINGLRCILDDHAWIFIDPYINDMPLLAWTNFKPRDSINASIACELRLYHIHAGLLISKSLVALQNTLHGLLQEKYGNTNDDVTNIDR